MLKIELNARPQGKVESLLFMLGLEAKHPEQLAQDRKVVHSLAVVQAELMNWEEEAMPFSIQFHVDVIKEAIKDLDYI